MLKMSSPTGRPFARSSDSRANASAGLELETDPRCPHGPLRPWVLGAISRTDPTPESHDDQRRRAPPVEQDCWCIYRSGLEGAPWDTMPRSIVTNSDGAPPRVAGGETRRTAFPSRIASSSRCPELATDLDWFASEKGRGQCSPGCFRCALTTEVRDYLAAAGVTPVALE